MALTLPAIRSASGQRHYPGEAVARVQLIQQLFAAGLSSRIIVDLLPCIYAPDDTGNPRSLTLLTAQRDRISAQIASMIQARASLNAIIEATAAGMCTTPAMPALPRSAAAG